MDISTSRRLARTPAALSMALGLAACASLDPTEDLDAAGQLVTDRAKVAVDWSGPWAADRAQWTPDRPLTADDAARLALANHARMRASVESIVQARADFAQAHLLPNPVINASLGFPIDSGSGSPWMAGLMLPVAALWQRPAAIDAADARLRAAVLTVSNGALTLVADARLAHARVASAARDLELELRGQAIANERLALVQQLFAEGEATGTQRDQAALDAVVADSHATSAGVRHDRAWRTLLEVCGVVGVSDLPELAVAATVVPDWVDAVTERQAVTLAEQQRLDLLAARLLAEGADDEVRLAELRRIRAVAAGAGYQENFSGREALGPSLSLELPLFDWGGTAVAKSESVARAAQAELEQVRQTAVGEVRHAWVRMHGDIANWVRLRDTGAPLATHNRERAEASFEAGVLDRPAVLDAALREVRVMRDVSAAELAAAESFIEFERAVGGQVVVTTSHRPGPALTEVTP